VKRILVPGVLGAVALLLMNVSALAATPADSTRAPRADSSALRAPRAAAGKALPSMHPKPSGRKRPRVRTAAHDTLSSAELKSLKLPPAPPPPTGRPPKVTAVALDVRHMVFGNFHEGVITGMKDEFRIGDSDYTGRIIEFVPDWAMGLQTFRVFSRSNEPNNPGFRIVVREKGQVRDTVWAFMHMPPHFARNSMLSFKVLRIEFADHPPVPAPRADSTSAHAARKPDSTRVGGGKRGKP
jgi:hypothetical protein